MKALQLNCKISLTIASLQKIWKEIWSVNFLTLNKMKHLMKCNPRLTIVKIHLFQMRPPLYVNHRFQPLLKRVMCHLIGIILMFDSRVQNRC